MRKHLWFGLTLLLVVAALVASAMLFVDYARPAPAFCDALGPCGRVRATPFARPLGIPLPAVGVLGMLALGFAALVPGFRARAAQAVLAGFAALVALLLLFVQASIGVLCPYCAVVDVSSLLLCALAFVRLVKQLDPPSGVAAYVSGGALVLATAVPMVIGFRMRALPTDLPPVIAAEIGQTPKGKVTVVDFVDFECPFCRMTHAALAPVLEQRKAKIRLARKHVPLERVHPHALAAAKAACCGEDLGKGDEMADALFRAPPTDLTPEGCEKLAEGQGLDLERFRACVRDPATQARIDQDRETFHAAKGHGLPLIFVDATRIDGAQDKDVFAKTIDSAISSL